MALGRQLKYFTPLVHSIFSTDQGLLLKSFPYQLDTHLYAHLRRNVLYYEYMHLYDITNQNSTCSFLHTVYKSEEGSAEIPQAWIDHRTLTDRVPPAHNVLYSAICSFKSYIRSQEVCLHASIISLGPFRGALSPVKPMRAESGLLVYGQLLPTRD